MTTTMNPSSSPSGGCGNYLLEEAAQLNAIGVRAFQQGQPSKAFHSLVSALKSLEQLRAYYHQLEQQQQQFHQPMMHHHYGAEPSSSASQSMTGEPPLQVQNFQAFSSNTTTNDPQETASAAAPLDIVPVPYMEDASFYMYKSSIIYPDQSISVAWPLDASYEAYQQQLLRRMVSALCFCEGATLFNLGLLYHHRGWNWGDSRALQDALRIYQQSQDRCKTWMQLYHRDHGANVEQQEQVQVMQLVGLNNMIHVHFQLAHFGKAQDLVNELLMQSVGALGGQEQELPAFLTKADIDGFLLNALVIRRHNTAPCA